MLLLQFGNMGKDTDQVQHEAVRREGDAAASRTCSPSGRTSGGRKPMAKGQRAAVPAFRPQTVAAE